jgi:hypothetical protein
MIDAIAAHLWQSTMFAGAAALLTLGFRANPARVRYWIWLAASLKFLFPFALLTTLGSHIHIGEPAVQKIVAPAPVLSYAAGYFSQCFRRSRRGRPLLPRLRIRSICSFPVCGDAALFAWP